MHGLRLRLSAEGTEAVWIGRTGTRHSDLDVMGLARKPRPRRPVITPFFNSGDVWLDPVRLVAPSLRYLDIH